MQESLIVAFVALGLVCSVLAGSVARERGRRVIEGAMLGLGLGPIGLAIAAFLPRPHRSRATKRATLALILHSWYRPRVFWHSRRGVGRREPAPSLPEPGLPSLRPIPPVRLIAPLPTPVAESPPPRQERKRRRLPRFKPNPTRAPATSRARSAAEPAPSMASAPFTRMETDPALFGQSVLIANTTATRKLGLAGQYATIRGVDVPGRGSQANSPRFLVQSDSGYVVLDGGDLIEVEETGTSAYLRDFCHSCFQPKHDCLCGLDRNRSRTNLIDGHFAQTSGPRY